MKLKYNSLHDFNDNLDNRLYLIDNKLYKLVKGKQCSNCDFRIFDEKYCSLYYYLGLLPIDVCVKKNPGFNNTTYIYRLIK